jgi:hypothetical protein
VLQVYLNLRRNSAVLKIPCIANYRIP